MSFLKPIAFSREDPILAAAARSTRAHLVQSPGPYPLPPRVVSIALEVEEEEMNRPPARAQDPFDLRYYLIL